MRLTASNSAPICDGSRMSVGTASVRGGGACANAAVSSSMSRRRPARTTFHPASSKTCAVARPMPLPAPVITAIFASVAMSDLPLASDGPAALLVGAVPEQPLILGRAAEGGQHSRPLRRRRFCRFLVGDVDDPLYGLAERRVGIGVDPGLIAIVRRRLAGDRPGDIPVEPKTWQQRCHQ